ncbi:MULTISPECIES: hypothetical protein [Emticicia]|uniref:hypothetical protein n=1 Tax=Emticicia TaxID=312278 RepID=UPI0007D8BCD2|nr:MULTISPECIES: hypothetical protein [Emticicia]
MKKLLLSFIFLFSCRVLFAQGDFTRIYHPIINSAELAIVDTNYYEALDYYKAAFDNVKKPFAKDYYNAAICAAMVGKMNTVFDYLEKIVEKGYPSDSLRKDAFFKYVADTCKVWKKFESQMRLVKPSINRELRDSLKVYHALITQEPYTPLTAELRTFYKEYTKKLQDSVMVKDRKTGKKEVFTQVIFPDSLTYFYGKMPEKLIKQLDSLRKINDLKTSNNMRLAVHKALNFIDIYGFPDESLIGLPEFNTKHSRVFRFNIYRQNDYPILDRNLAVSILGGSLFTYGKDLTPMLIQAIRDGKIPPHQINRVGNAPLETNNSNAEKTPNFYSMGNVKVLQYRLDENLNCENRLLQGKDDKKFWKKEQLSLYSEAEINEKRLDIGLETLADAYKKAFFKAHPRVFIINGGSYQTELSYVSSCEVLEKMLKESTFVR